MMGPASLFPELPLRTIVLSLRENENASQADVNASVSVACWVPSGKQILKGTHGGCTITCASFNDLNFPKEGNLLPGAGQGPRTWGSLRIRDHSMY